MAPTSTPAVHPLDPAAATPAAGAGATPLGSEPGQRASMWAAMREDLRDMGRGLLVAAMMVLLGPLLLWQGLRVRRVTPRLPEAAGPREGVTLPDPWHGMPSVKPFRLLILGDSSAAGVGAATQQQALSGQLADALARRLHRPVQWRVVAQTGLTSDTLLAHLQASPPDAYDLACVAIGVNDVTERVPIEVWRRQLEQLLMMLRLRHRDPWVLVSALPPMHQFPALPQPLRFWLGQIARRLDRYAQALVQQHAHAVHVPMPVLMPPPHGAPDLQVDQVMASDGFHPGPLAYQIWAEHLAQLVCTLLDRPGSKV